jgi:hypothetical protein
MPSSIDMEDYIHGDVFVPIVVVIATERVRVFLEESVGITPAGLFAPLGGYYTPITCDFRALDRDSRINGFKVRFVDVHDAFFKEGECVKQGESSFRSNRRGFENWFSGFCHGTSWSTTDCLSQPITTLLLVAADEENVTDCFEQLGHEAIQPGLCREGELDSTSPRVRVLLDTPSSPPGVFDQLRLMYPENSVHFLHLISPTHAIPEIGEMYAKFSIPPPLLSWDDIEGLNRLTNSLVTRWAIPWMCSRLTQLDNHITAKRRGFRNQLKNFLRAAPAESPVSSSVMTLRQSEWECRLAGDFAFHLRLHDLAFGYYRSVASDMKIDRFFLQAAGCYEWSGLCGWLGGGGDRADWIRYFETAIELYRTSGPFALRAGILESFVLSGTVQAGELLIRLNAQNGSVGVQNAVLLEQAATLYSHAGMHRKAQFTRVLAGHMYNKLEGLKPNALACYAEVVDKYPPGWVFISDHLVFTMAKLEFSLGNTKESLELVFRLVESVASNKTAATPSVTEKHTNYLKLVTFIGARNEVTDNVAMKLPKLVSVGRVDDFVKIVFTNPFSIEITISGVKVEFSHNSTESEVSGPVTLGPLETSHELTLQCVGDEETISNVQWNLYGLNIVVSEINGN